MGEGGEERPLPRLLDIQQHLKELQHSIRYIAGSIEDSERHAEVKRKQMELIRQRVYDALAPRPCRGSLLTCLQAGIPPNLHQGSFATPALKFPCYGHDCDRKVLAKPLRRPMYTTARPSGGIHRPKDFCKYHQASCHHNRILPTYAPIRFNKIPMGNVFTTTRPATTTSYAEKNKQSITTPTRKYITLPEKLYNLTFNPSTKPSVIDAVKPTDLRDGSIKLENEILGITEKHHNHGLKTDSSIQNKHSTVIIEVTTQSHTAKNRNTSTAQTIIVVGSSLNSDNDGSTQSYYSPKNSSSQANLLLNKTFIGNRSLTKNEGDMTIFEIVKYLTTVTQRTAFDEAFLTTQVGPMDTRSQESKAEPNVPVGHVSPVPTISPASENTTVRVTLHEDLLTTQVSLMDSTSQKSKAELNESVSPDSTTSNSEYTTLRTALDEVLLTTHINAMDSAHQKSKAEPNQDVGNLSTDSTISPESEYTTLRVERDEVLLNTQISLMDTKPEQEKKVEPNYLVDNFSIDSLISPAPEYTTLRTALDEVLLTTQLISKDIAPDQERTAEPNLPHYSSTSSSISEYPLIDSSFHEASPTTWRIGDSTITVSLKEGAVSKTSAIGETKQILAEEDLQPSTSMNPNEALSRGDSSIYFTTEIIEDLTTVVDDISGRTDADTVQTTAVIRVVETGTTEFPFETTTLQFESKTDPEQIFDQDTENLEYALKTNVPEQEEITGHFSLSQNQNPHHISHAIERAAFSGLENEQRAYQDGVWKFTSELENYDDRFSNDEGSAPMSNGEIALAHRSRREVANELKLEPHMEAFVNNSSLSFTAKNNSITFNASNILELWPVIREGDKNNALAEEDMKVISSIFGQMKLLLGEDALAESTEPELLGDRTLRIEGDQEDYECPDSTEEGIREKRSRKIAKLVKDPVRRLPDSLRNKLVDSFTRTSRGKRSTGVQPVSEAAAILALLAEGGGAVQLDGADDEYEYYEYEDDEEYGDQYEDVDEEYDDNPSFKELIVLANKHRKRKEVKS